MAAVEVRTAVTCTDELVIKTFLFLHHIKLLLNSFHLSGHTLDIYSQTWRLDPSSTTK